MLKINISELIKSPLELTKSIDLEDAGRFTYLDLTPHIEATKYAVLCNTEGKMFQHKYCFKQEFPSDFVDIPAIFYISLYIHVALSSGPRAIL